MQIMGFTGVGVDTAEGGGLAVADPPQPAGPSVWRTCGGQASGQEKTAEVAAPTPAESEAKVKAQEEAERAERIRILGDMATMIGDLQRGENALISGLFRNLLGVGPAGHKSAQRILDHREEIRRRVLEVLETELERLGTPGAPTLDP